MRTKSRQPALTLIEMVVVISAVALLTILSLPALRTFLNSFTFSGSARPMISAALSSARAIAAREQSYAGIRFQKAYGPNDLQAPQYMIFIVHEEPSKMRGLTIGFRAVEGLQPIRLPDSVGVMDLKINGNDNLVDPVINDDLLDTTTFSIIFSPSGKLVIHEVRVRNRDGYYQPDNGGTKVSMDDIFNSPVNIALYKTGMFVQDDYAELGLGAEPSRNNFIIYDRNIFDQLDEGSRYKDYLADLQRIYINPYTGTIIDR